MEIEKNKEDESKIAVLLEDLTSLEKYASDLFAFLPMPVCLISSIGIFLEVNPAFEKITGYTTEEIIGKNIESVFDEGRIKELTKETVEKGLIKAREIDIFTKEKKKIPVSASSVLRKSEEGEIIGYFIGIFDLSDIKKKEDELKNTQKALLNILEDTEEARREIETEKNKTLAVIDNFTDGLLVFDEKNNLSLANPKAKDFFNIKNKEAAGKSILELTVFPEIKPLATLLGKEIKGVFRKEIQVKENLVLEVSTVPMTRKTEKLGTLVILHDITREKTIERMKTEFVSLAAHQLRTPLSAIKWALKMLLDEDLGKINEEQKDFIEKTYRSNERMINLINDLLDVARIEEGRYLYKPSPADIEELSQSVVNSYKEAVKRKNIRFQFKKPKKKLPQVTMDVEKIRLVIENLLDNAMRYTPPGGEVTVILKGDAKEVQLSVKDSGIGIPKDQQGRVFTKFFRAANVMKMETEGTGLGLFITRNIIESHGGKIWFESEEGKGTTFYFTLPIKEKFAEFLKEF